MTISREKHATVTISRETHATVTISRKTRTIVTIFRETHATVTISRDICATVTISRETNAPVTISRETHSFALAQHLVTQSTHRVQVQNLLRRALGLLWNMPVTDDRCGRKVADGPLSPVTLEGQNGGSLYPLPIWRTYLECSEHLLNQMRQSHAFSHGCDHGEAFV